MKNIIITFIVLMSSKLVFADWIGPYSISMVEANETQIMFYKPVDITSFPNPFSCSVNTAIVFDGTTKLGDRALSIGLAAQTTNKKVRYFIYGCSGPYIKAIVIRNEP